MEQVCVSCKENKPLEEFHKNKNSANGRVTKCKQCVSDKSKEYYKEHKETVKERAQQYRKNNKDTIKQRNKVYTQRNKDVIKRKQKEYRDAHKDQSKEYSKQYRNKFQDKLAIDKKRYRELHKEKLKVKRKEYVDKNHVDIIAKQKVYRDKNKHKATAYHKKYRQTRRKEIADKKREYQRSRRTDPVFKLIENIRSLINISFHRNGFTKKSKTCEILGCDFDFILNYLQMTFLGNYGVLWRPEFKIAIDHIIPISTNKGEDDVIKLNHFTNLQWLFAKHNIEKSNSIMYDIPVFDENDLELYN